MLEKKKKKLPNLNLGSPHREVPSACFPPPVNMSEAKKACLFLETQSSSENML